MSEYVFLSALVQSLQKDVTIVKAEQTRLERRVRELERKRSPSPHRQVTSTRRREKRSRSRSRGSRSRSVDRRRSPPISRGGGGGGGGGDASSPSRGAGGQQQPRRPYYSHLQSVHVNNLRGLDCFDNDQECRRRLTDILGQYGQVVDVFIGSNGLWAKVSFATEDEANKCLAEFDNSSSCITIERQLPPIDKRAKR